MINILSAFSLKAMRVFAVLSCILLLVTACHFVPVGSNREPNDSSSAIVPGVAASIFSNKVELMFVNVRINQSNGIFLIDTGSSRTTLNETFAKRIGISGRPDHYPTITPYRAITLSEALVEHVSVANLKISNHFVKTRPDKVLREIESSISLPFSDGLIGGDILMHYRGSLDLTEMKLTFSLPEGQKPPNNEEVIARLHATSNENIIGIEARIDGTDAFLMIDTGVNYFGTISRNSKLHGVLRRTVVSPIKLYSGLERHEENEILVAGHVEIGNIACDDIPLGIDPPPPPQKIFPKGARTFDGSLGLQFFMDNKLIIDYGRMEVRRRTSPITAAIGQAEAALNRSLGHGENPGSLRRTKRR